MYRTILVPLDGSRRAEAILPHVEKLAQQMGSTLILLQVVDPTSTAVGLEGMPIDVLRQLIDEETQNAENYLRQKCSELSSNTVTATPLVRYGNIIQMIIEAAEDHGADLIALASHGRTGLARMFYGSVAAGILHRVDRPLLLIRADA
jgi:nucleotide-binding universal stress UspA family protein